MLISRPCNRLLVDQVSEWYFKHLLPTKCERKSNYLTWWFLTAMHFTNFSEQYQVFEVYPLLSKASFCLTASLPPHSPNETYIYILAGDLFVYQDGPLITVWNILQDAWTRWETANAIGEVRGLNFC